MSRTAFSKKAKVVLLATAASTLISGGLLATTATSASGEAAAPTAAASTCGALFDDFNYSSPSDPNFTSRGWQARNNAGGPGVPGAGWSANNISFPTVDGQKAARLTAYTDGTAAGTSQAEFLTTRKRFLNGTYASRIRFTDAPVSGADGDHINETFFAIGPAQRYDYDPLYSELDFSEYLPNGGWGATGPINYQTSYNGYRAEPWDPRNAQSSQTRSLNGWHTVLAQVDSSRVKYFIDGVQVGEHSVDDQTRTLPVTPRVPMSINFNLWFIDFAAHSGGRSTYVQDVDWVYHAKDQTISPNDVTATAASLRAAGTTHVDTVDAGGCTTTGNRVISSLNNKCIEVPRSNFTPGQPLAMQDCTGGANQAWQFVNGTLRSQNNLCMDAAGAGTANGTVIQVATCNGNTAQQFVLGANGALVNQRANKCVDIEAWNANNGARIHLWDCHGGANQTWRRG